MQKASQGIPLTELIEDLNSNLVYGGARRISEYEAELLDQLDDSFDAQVGLQRKVDSLEKNLLTMRAELEKTDGAIGEYCSETTRKKILLARGWQFRTEEATQIEGALSDKDIVEKGTPLTLQQIGEGTTRDFSSNPERASEAFETLESGVRTQEEIKEGQTQGEE